MSRKPPPKNRKTEDDVLQQIRDAEEQAIVAVYRSELEHDDGLFEHLGFSRRPALAQFRSWYVRDGKVDFDRLTSDVWAHEPTATRWRAKNEAAGITAEWYLHRLLNVIERLERIDPRPAELQQLYSVRDRFMVPNAIRRH